MHSFITKSEKETLRLAADFARQLKGGEIIGLIGELGSGKTVFAKGLGKGLGIKKTITSPTFNIMKLYDAPKKRRGRIRYLCHIDAYRIDASGLEAVGAWDFLGKADVVAVIEWANLIKNALAPEKTALILFKAGQGLAENTRMLEFK